METPMLQEVAVGKKTYYKMHDTYRIAWSPKERGLLPGKIRWNNR
jgi:hypothetical protein